MKQFKFSFREKEIEIINQTLNLEFTFIQFDKKHVGIENLVSKVKKTWFLI